MDWTAATAFFGVIAALVAFFVIFQFRKKPKAKEASRDRKSYWGIGLQAVAFWITWFFARPYFSPIVPMPWIAEAGVTALTLIVAGSSVWLCASAVRTLGKQWTYGARVIEDHELIMQGPYSRVRNPIYLGMFGMLLASGLAVGRWPVVIAAIAIFLIGTRIRIRTEEALLRNAFGEKFEAYARQVPAFVPRLS